MPYFHRNLDKMALTINGPSINNENNLKKRIKESEDKNKDSEYLIYGKLHEKDEQIKSNRSVFICQKYAQSTG